MNKGIELLIRNRNIIDHIDLIRNKGDCFHTTGRTYRNMIFLKELLLQEEYTELSIALDHFQLGKSAGRAI